VVFFLQFKVEMLYSWKLFVAILALISLSYTTHGFVGVNVVNQRAAVTRSSGSRVRITATLDELEKKVLAAAPVPEIPKLTTVSKVVVAKPSPVPKPPAVPKNEEKKEKSTLVKTNPLKLPKREKKPVSVPKPAPKPVPKQTASISSGQIAAGVGLGAAPWVIAPFVALSAGRELLMKTQNARAEALRKLEEERLAELAKLKTSEPVSWRLEGNEGTAFLTAVAAIGVGIAGIFYQVKTAPIVEAPQFVAPAPAAKAPVTSVKGIEDAEKKAEQAIKKAEIKAEKAIKKELEEVEYQLEDKTRNAKTEVVKDIVKVEKAAVKVEKVVEKDLSAVEKAVEKDILVVEKDILAVEKAVEKDFEAVEKTFGLKPLKVTPSAPVTPATVSKPWQAKQKKTQPTAPADVKSESIDPELLKALKAGKYKTFSN